MTFESRIFEKLRKQTFIQRVHVEDKSYVIKHANFYIKPNEKSKFVEYRLKTLKEDFIEILGNDCKIERVNSDSKCSYTTIGIITNLTNAKLDENNVYITSVIDESNKIPVKLNLEFLKRFSLFPGQIISVTGKNIEGNVLNVEEIYSLCPLKTNQDYETKILQYYQIYNDKPLQILFMAGPFGKHLDFEILDKILQKSCDLLILLGPFANQVDENLEKSNEIMKIFELKLLNWIENSHGRKVLLIPSCLDIPSFGIYPIHKFTSTVDNEGLIYMTNPSTFYVNEMLFSCNNFDILWQLNLNECYRETRTKKSIYDNENFKVLFEKDRNHRICSHLIFQKSFLPVFPAKGVINYSNPNVFNIETTPDFFITSSKLINFIGQVGPTSIINLNTSNQIETKKYAKITVLPIKTLVPDQIPEIHDRCIIEELEL